MSIATYIEKDLKSLIDSGQELPAKLTLQGLSDHYDVSFTPVRAAVSQLVRDNYLQKSDSGRLSVHPQRLNRTRRGKRTTDKEATPPQDWYGVLSADVFKQSLRGDAVYLREEATAEKYGIGRTVVRRIFNRMAGAGLIEHVPRTGWKVRPFRVEEMRSYLQVREVLELKALELAHGHLDQDVLQQMLAGNTPDTASHRPRLDNDLHRYLIEQSNNRFILDFFDQHGRYFTALFDYAALGADVVSEMAGQHREILEALIAEDWDGAAQALSNHIWSQQPVLERLISSLRKQFATK